MSSPPPKRVKTTPSAAAAAAAATASSGMPLSTASIPPAISTDHPPAQTTPSTTPTNLRKRRNSTSAGSPTTTLTATPTGMEPIVGSASNATSEPKKKGRTNTPWTAQEEQLLQQMRTENKGWSEIAKRFPARTEGSVKKHWYKDMHYAEFNEEEANTLRDAIREYDANKWKTIGTKVGKPAKACEHYAREHFRSS